MKQPKRKLDVRQLQRRAPPSTGVSNFLVKRPTTLQTPWDYLKHHHIGETQSYPPLYVISFSLISHGSKAESLIPLCFVLKIFMFWLLLSDRLWGPWECRIWLPIFEFILFGVWNSADSQKINFIESFFQEGWQLGSELSNQSCIKYPMLGLHGISHFMYFRLEFSPFWFH